MLECISFCSNVHVYRSIFCKMGNVFIQYSSTISDHQSDHGTRICYHRWAISEQLLQAPPPFFLPQAKLSSLHSAIFFFAPLHLGACSQASFSLVTRVLWTLLLLFIRKSKKLRVVITQHQPLWPIVAYFCPWATRDF